jgi:crossover junction endodeoxyribonuclease RuvC
MASLKSSTTQVIIGIDPGMARLGWGVVVKEGAGVIKLIAYGVIETPAKQNTNTRLLTLHNELKKIIGNFQPNQVGIEKLFFGKNAKTAMMVGEARGVALLTVSQFDLPIQEYTPAEVKIAITGYGNADKRQMQEMVKQTLALPKIPQPDDAADALAVALTVAFTNRII